MKRYVIISMLLTVVVCTAAFAAAKTPGEIDSVHKKAGLTCIECHGTDAPDKRAGQGACKECHGDKTEKKLVKITDAKGKNYETVIHNNPHTGPLRCTLCHRTHEQSVLYCNTDGCHTHKLSVP